MDSTRDLDRATYFPCECADDWLRVIGRQKAPQVLEHREDQALFGRVDDLSSAVRGQIVDGVAEGFHQIAAKGFVILSAHAHMTSAFCLSAFSRRMAAM